VTLRDAPFANKPGDAGPGNRPVGRSEVFLATVP
jgi:hypothetical protein